MYYTIFAKREENFLAKIDVAPLAGARIEILLRVGCMVYRTWSLPSRERGLKFSGFWMLSAHLRRSPRGSAD